MQTASPKRAVINKHDICCEVLQRSLVLAHLRGHAVQKETGQVVNNLVQCGEARCAVDGLVVYEHIWWHGKECCSRCCDPSLIGRSAHPQHLMATSNQFPDDGLRGVEMARVRVCGNEDFHEDSMRTAEKLCR